MPGPSIRVAGAHVTLSARSDQYQAGVQRAINANRQFNLSATQLTGVLGRFQQSLTSSVIATAAYATGIGLLTRAFSGSNSEFLEFERNLITVQKTADLTAAQTEALGRGIRRLVTETSSLGQPLPVARDELERIAIVAGQMNIRGTRDILAFTETVGLLTLTTDLAGDAAANAIGKIIATTQSGVDEIENLGSALTALGNAFRGGERDILSQATFLATQTAAFQLPTEDILAYSAVLSAGGQRPETAGTAFARVLQALTDAASELANNGDFNKLAVITSQVRDEFDNAEQSARNLSDTILRGDYTSAINTLLVALREAGPEESGNIFTTLLGGDVVPTRVAGIFNFLANNFDEVTRAANVSGDAWQSAIATLEEAGRFAEARSLRLLVVQNKLRDQALEFGDILSRIFVNVGEVVGDSFNVIQVGLTGLLAAVGTRFISGRISAAREISRLQGQSLKNAVMEAREARDLNRTLLERSQTTAREVATQNRLFIAASNRQESEARNVRRLQAQRNEIANLRAGAQTRLGIQQQQLGPLARVGGADINVQRLRNRETLAVARLRRANADLERTREQIAVGSRLYTNEAVARQEANVAQAQRRLIDRQRELNNAIRQQNAFLTRGQTLLSRFGRGLYNFLGGPLGIINLAIVGGITAWQIWGETVNEAQAEVDDLLQRVDDLIQQQGQLNAGRTPVGFAIDEVDSRVRAEETRLADLQAQLEEADRRRVEIAAGQQLFDDSEINQLNDQIETVTQNIDNLRNRSAELRDVVSGASLEWEGFGDVIDRSALSFQLIDLRLRGAGDAARDFTRTLLDERRQQEREFDEGFIDAFAPPIVQFRFRRESEIVNRANDAVRDLERRLSDAQIETERVESALAEAETLSGNLQLFSPGSDDARNAQNQEADFRRRLAVTRNDVILAQARLDAQREASSLAIEGAAEEASRYAAEQRIIDIAQRRQREIRVNLPDLVAIRREAFRELNNEQARLSEEIRRTNQQIVIDSLDPVNAAGQRAEFDVRNRRADQIAQSLERLITAYENQSIAQLRVRSTTNALVNALNGNVDGLDKTTEATDANINALIDLEHEAQTRLERANVEVNSEQTRTNAILSQKQAWDDAAISAGNYARNIAAVGKEIEQIEIVFIDAAAQIRIVDQQLLDLTRQVQRRGREISQNAIIDTIIDPGAQAGQAAYFDIINRYEDSLTSLRDQIDLASRAIIDGERNLSVQNRVLDNAIGTNREQSARSIVDSIEDEIVAERKLRDEKTIQLARTLELRDAYIDLANEAAAQERAANDLAAQIEELTQAFADLYAQQRIAQRQFRSFRDDLNSNILRDIQDDFLSGLDPISAARQSQIFNAENVYGNNLLQAQNALQDAEEDLIDLLATRADLQERIDVTDDEGILAGLRTLREDTFQQERALRILGVELRARIEFIQALEDAYRDAGESAGEFYATLERLQQDRILQTPLPIEFPDINEQRREARRFLDEYTRAFEEAQRDSLQSGEVDVVRLFDPIAAEGLAARFDEENRVAERRADLTEMLVNLERLLVDQVDERARLTDQLNQSEDATRLQYINKIQQQRVSIRETRFEIAEINALIDANDDLEESFENIADRASEFAMLLEMFRQNRILQQPFPIELPDIATQRREVRAFFDELVLEFDQSQRDALQRIQVDEEVSPINRLRLSSRLDLENQRDDRAIELRSRLIDLERKFIDQVNDRIRLNDLRISSDGEERLQLTNKLRARQVEIRQIARSIVETKALIAANDELEGTYDGLIDRAEQFAITQRSAQLRAIFDSFQAPEPPDFNETRRTVEAELRELGEFIRNEQRQLFSENRVAQLSIVPAAGFEARFRLENDRDDRLRRARRELAIVQERLNEATREYQNIEQGFAFSREITNAQAERLVQQRARVEELENESAAIENLIVFLSEATGQYSQFVNQAERIAEARVQTPLKELGRSAMNLDDILESTTANGLRNFESALVDVFRTGKLELDSLVEAIAIDLIQALIRATITANLARAALSFLGGGSVTPATGSQTGVGGGGPAGFQFGHSGGIVGNLEYRSLSSPLRSREELAILERGEEILTRNDPRHRWNIRGQSLSSIRAWVNSLPKYHDGGVVGVGSDGSRYRASDSRPEIEINFINQTSRDAQIEDNGLRFNGEKWVQGVILRDMSRNGPITQNMRRSVLGSRI